MSDKNLDQNAIAASISHNREYPNHLPTHSIPIPHSDEDLHVGAIVAAANNRFTLYTINRFEPDGWAVVVPLINPVAAYPVRVKELRPATHTEIVNYVYRSGPAPAP